MMSLISKLNFRIGKLIGRERRDKPVAHKDALPGAYTVPQDRQLNAEERTLIEWLIANGIPEAKNYAQQLEGLHVVSHCSCGCPTVDLAVVNAQASTTGPSRILADFLGLPPEGKQVGVTLHAREGKLSELEVYPRGETVGPALPRIETLNPFDRPKDWA
jgi:hypothetical protein